MGTFSVPSIVQGMDMVITAAKSGTTVPSSRWQNSNPEKSRNMPKVTQIDLSNSRYLGHTTGVIPISPYGPLTRILNDLLSSHNSPMWETEQRK